MISDEFKAKRFLYVELERAARPLLEQLATESGIAVALIEGRVKAETSFDEKISRSDKEGKYQCLEDVTDICGLRVVLYTAGDCQTIIAAIRENFSVDENNSIVKGKDFEEDRFGYSSTHLIASLLPERVELFEFRKLAKLKMEIQIRTVLQHAWAVLDWRLRYKTEKETPRELRRKLYRVSALLEAADDTFWDLLQRSEGLHSRYGRCDRPR